MIERPPVARGTAVRRLGALCRDDVLATCLPPDSFAETMRRP